MKQYFSVSVVIITLMFILNGCSSYPMFETHTGFVDYYSAGLDGKVFITESNSVSFEYIPIGSITSCQRSGYTQTKGKWKQSVVLGGDPVYGYSEINEYRPDKDSYRLADFQTLLTEASNTAMEMGGDAIINLKISYIQDDKEPRGKVPHMTGMVVKRK